jgi:hypothetical protein
MSWWRKLFGGGDSEIEELRTRANAFIKEYPRKTSKDQVERAYGYYKEAYRIFMDDLNESSDTPQSTLDKMEKALSDALRSAPENALLFHTCLDLLTASRKYVNEAQCKWLDEASQRLGTIWPDMLRSYQYTRQAQSSGVNTALAGMMGGFTAVFVDPEIHQAGQPGKRVERPGLESVKACPFNPDAWFQLKFEVGIHQGNKAYSDTFTEVEESLKEVQGQKILDAIKGH